MTRPEMAHLELLAELDWLSDWLKRWAAAAPNWEPARAAQALVRRLLERTEAIRLRAECPLVVANIGGTGTGKSALINALLGEEVVPVGRSRPTTRVPTVICRPTISPESLGIDADSVQVVHRDLPVLADMVLIDCPDPDTTESPDGRGTNLARLRAILPYCDVLLVTTTQQKYRSARMANELAAAASGARLIFVQTHAEVDEDIREDWRRVLEPEYETGHIFLVDSLAALADARQGRPPQGEWAALVDLLTRQLAGTAAGRIRRANFLDLVAETLNRCARRLDEGLAAVEKLQRAIAERRAVLAAKVAAAMRQELLASRRQWESRLVGKVVSRWGFSPFALLLRIYQGLGGLLSGALLVRARTPAQLALWGAWEAGRTWRRRRTHRHVDRAVEQVLAGCWDSAQLREAATVLAGFAAEAGLDRQPVEPEVVTQEAAAAGEQFVAGVSREVESVLDRVAARHTRWYTRWLYEVLFLGMLGVLLFRPAKNFFYDSWLAPEPSPLYGLDFYLLSAFWLLLWACLLLWAFTGRLRRGLRKQIHRLAQGWTKPEAAEGVFARLEGQCRQAGRFRDELERLVQHVSGLRRRLGLPDEHLGHRR